MKTTFRIGEVFQKGFDLTKKHWQFLVSATLIYLVINYGLPRIAHGLFGGVLGLVGLIVSFVFSIGMYTIALKVLDGAKPVKEDFKTDIDTFLSFVWISIIVGAIVIFGTVLFIVPGIIAAVRLSLSYYVFFDKKMYGWAAVKESWNLTKGYSWNILGFFICSIILSIIAVIPLGLGLLFVVPLIIITQAVIYKKIAGNKGDVVVEPVPAPTPATLEPGEPALVNPEHSEAQAVIE